MNRITYRSDMFASRKQQGLALVISLVLLVAMTVIALATMSGTRLNERITSNAQQKAISFEAAESAISSVWSHESARTALALMTDSANDPAAVSLPDVNEKLSEIFDQRPVGYKAGDTDYSVDITASVTIQYCGEGVSYGTQTDVDESQNQMIGVVYDFNGVSSVAGSKARSDHLQRGSVPGYKTGRTGNCTTPN